MKHLLSIIICLCLVSCSTVTRSYAPVLDLSYDRSQFSYHQVELNETIADIAAAYDVDSKSILTTNHIKPNVKIHQGQMIKIPEYLAQNQNNLTNDRDIFKVPAGWAMPLHATFSSKKDPRGGWMLYSKKSNFVYAPQAGKVVSIKHQLKDLGQVVVIKHADNRISVFGLLSEIFVKKGAYVEKGEKIARIGIKIRGKTVTYASIDKLY